MFCATACTVRGKQDDTALYLQANMEHHDIFQAVTQKEDYPCPHVPPPTEQIYLNIIIFSKFPS